MYEKTTKKVNKISAELFELAENLSTEIQTAEFPKTRGDYQKLIMGIEYAKALKTAMDLLDQAVEFYGDYFEAREPEEK